MNKDNYATPKASKKLVDAGIALETDAVWYASPVTKRISLEMKENLLARGL